jgi:pilus assembly protein Flp/PilA
MKTAIKIQNQSNTKEDVMKKLATLMKDESGQTMVEYGLLIALISIAVIAVLVLLGPRIAGFFQAVDDQLASSTPGATPAP